MQTNLESMITDAPRSNGKKKFTVILAVVLALLVAGTAYGYFALDLFKSAKQIYFESELHNFKNLSQSMGDSYDQYYKESVEPYLNNSVHSNMEITANVAGIPIPDPSGEKVLDLLKKSKLVIDSSRDDKNQQQYVKADLHVDGNKLIGIEGFSDKTKLGFGVPAIYNKYGVVDLKDRDKLKQRYGIDQLPKRILTYNDYLNALKTSKEEYEPILTDYVKLYADSLNDKQIVINKNATFKEGNAELPAREITVTFTKEQFEDLTKKFSDKLAGDDKLVDLLHAKSQNLYNLLQDSGYESSGMKQPDKAEIKKQLQNSAKDFNDSVKNADLSDGVKMVLLVDSKDNILDRKVTIGKGDNNSLNIHTANWTDKDQKHNALFELKGADKTSTGEFKINYTNKAEDSKTQKGTVGVSFKETANGKENNSLLIDSQFTVVKDGDKQNTEATFTATDKGALDTNKVSGEIKGNVVKNDKEKSRDFQTSAQVKIDAAGQGLKGATLGIDIKGKEEFGKGVKLPTLDANNSIDLANASDEELDKAKQEIAAAAQGFLFKNMMLLQTFMQ